MVNGNSGFTLLLGVFSSSHVQVVTF